MQLNQRHGSNEWFYCQIVTFSEYNSTFTEREQSLHNTPCK